jgi:sulfur carrier protein
MTGASKTLRVRINDRTRDVPEGLALLGLLDEMGLGGSQGVAVAVNASVVPRTEWAARVLADGDQVLVIQASQGG